MVITYSFQINLWVKISIVCPGIILSPYWRIQKNQDRHQMRLVKREAAIELHTLPIKEVNRERNTAIFFWPLEVCVRECFHTTTALKDHFPPATRIQKIAPCFKMRLILTDLSSWHVSELCQSIQIWGKNFDSTLFHKHANTNPGRMYGGF